MVENEGIFLNNKEIIILNYVMDEGDKLLSHQVEIVNLLSKEFDRVYVLTGRIGQATLSSNITLLCYDWIQGQKFLNALKLIIAFLQLTKKNRAKILFSHMTFYQSIIILPFTKILKIRHFLWYAHKKENKYLSLSHKFFDGIVTSTRNSCPIKSEKVYPIGQTINADKFKPKGKITYPIIKLIHIGRFDPIKKISEIISSVQEAKFYFPKLELDIVGSATSTKSMIYEKKVKLSFQKAVNQGWLRFTPGVPRDQIPFLLSESHAFIHSCDAALDKVLLEASISKVPVVTTNQEYINFFGSWGEEKGLKSIELDHELKAMLEYTIEDMYKVVNYRYQLTIDHHELNGWTQRLMKVICS
jgi:glycosyltransferase involved in cell wall biosynthesis